MPIISNGANIRGVSYGATAINKVYYGSDLVWQADKRETVVFPPTSTTYGARNFFRNALSERGLNYSTVVEIPFNMDTSQVTNTNNMFYGCSSLTSVPEMDTSQVTTMLNMFRGCSSLAYVPDMDTSNVKNTSNMFYGCSSLTDGNARLIRKDGTLPLLRTDMIAGSGLTREPFFNANGNPIP